MVEPAPSLSQPVVGLPVGVVVIGRNEGNRLIRCLDSLAPHGVAVVYVDSASSDGSRQAATTRKAAVVELDMALAFTAARARNEGFARLVADHPALLYVQFIDGDCEIEQGWLDAAVATLSANGDVAAVCGRRRERFPKASPYNSLCDDEWNTPIGDTLACGGDALFRADAFAAVGGFDAGLIAGEEPELCARLRAGGHHIRRIDAPMTIHDAALHRFQSWWIRCARGGYGYAQVWSKTRHRLEPLYATQLVRSMFWVIGVPVIAMAGAMVAGAWVLLLIPVVHGMQVARIASRLRTIGRTSRWRHALLLHTAKFAEAMGILRFIRQAVLGQRRDAVLYK